MLIHFHFAMIYIFFYFFAGKPDTPLEFDVKGKGYDWVKLKAQSGFYNGAEQTFVIQFRKADNSTGWRNYSSEHIGSDKGVEKETVVGQLDDKTEYLFRIYSFNIYGKSDFTSELRVTTNGRFQ